MKKIFAAVITAFLMSAGLVATTSSPAAAACTYPATCFPTITQGSGLNAGANKAKVFVRVGTFGNGRATGPVVFTFVKNNGKSFTFTRDYPAARGKGNIFNFRGLNKGRYTVIVTYQGTDEKYLGSGTSFNTRVKGPRRR